MKKSMLLILFFWLSALLGQALPKPVIEDKIKDVFVPVEYEGQKAAFEGYIGERMRVNLEERLLKLHTQSILEPYINRPGKQTWIGEHVGKYLHAACYAWQYTGDQRLKARMDSVVLVLIAAQLPDGYLGTYEDKNRWTEWDVWSHKYNLIGLLTYYQATGYEPALAASRKIGDLLYATFSETKKDIIASSWHVGMASTSVLEPMVMLYRYTGEQRYLQFCNYIIKSWEQRNGPNILNSLLKHGNVYKTANAKAYEMLSNLVGLLDLYRITGNITYLTACTNAWKDIMTKRHFVTGTSSWAEHFGSDYDLKGDGEQHGDKYVAAGEGCVTVTWLQMNWHLLRLTGEAAYAHELERITYNALLGAQSPKDGRVCYFVPLEGKRRYGEVTHGIEPDVSCCSSSIPRGIALIPYFSVGTIQGKAAILQYIPGSYAVKSGGVAVNINIETNYPEDGEVNLSVTPDKPGNFPLLLRIPDWANIYTVTIGDEKYTGEKGKFLTVERNWHSGDIVKISMDLPLRELPDEDKYSTGVYIQRGPQILAVDEQLTAMAQLPAGWKGNQFYSYNNLGKKMHLVPFAEAGQNKGNYQVMLEKKPDEGTPEQLLADYRDNLQALRKAHPNLRQMPDLHFFLFGMGDRLKIIYKNGKLINVSTGDVLKQWQIKKELIVPSAYTVYLETQDGLKIRIVENEKGVYVFDNKKTTALSESKLSLPTFEGHPYAPILRVLHHEILINVHKGLPVPNFMVYQKPWFRDAALMGMVMKQTGNLHLIKDWIMNIRDPFDRNNHGMSEADNLGQILYLVSLVSDATHPVVQTVLDSVKQFHKENYIEGKTDYALHPVFQTKWIKYGLKSLSIEDSYQIPKVYDSYSSLFWWGYKEQHVDGKRFDEQSSQNYPYLVWSEDHFYGENKGIVTNQDYPLSWEAHASDANYPGLKVLDEDLVKQKLNPTHTWHAAEMFLLLTDLKDKK